MRLMKKYIKYIALCLLVAVSCEQLPEEVDIYGIGAYDLNDKGTALREKTLNVDAGKYVLGIYADGDFTASLEEDDTWLRFAANEDLRQFTGNGNTTITFVYDINKGIPRTAVLTLQRGNNVFKLTFTQSGILEGGVVIQQKNLSIQSEGGRCGAKVITRIQPEDGDISGSNNSVSSHYPAGSWFNPQRLCRTGWYGAWRIGKLRRGMAFYPFIQDQRGGDALQSGAASLRL